MNTLIISAIIVLAIGEIIFGGMCVVWIKKLDEEREELKNARDIYEINMKYMNRMIDVEHKFMKDLWDRVDTITDVQTQNNELTIKIYDQYKAIYDQHSKLLECWKSIEERYSDGYEQYKRNSEYLERIMDLMEPEVQSGVVDLETEIFTPNGTEE